MYNINEHIAKELYNEYGGSERKKTVQITALGRASVESLLFCGYCKRPVI